MKRITHRTRRNVPIALTCKNCLTEFETDTYLLDGEPDSQGVYKKVKCVCVECKEKFSNDIEGLVVVPKDENNNQLVPVCAGAPTPVDPDPAATAGTFTPIRTLTPEEVQEIMKTPAGEVPIAEQTIAEQTILNAPDVR